MVVLTRRQKEVLSTLLDLYRQEGNPIHYSLLADQLGVGKISAYEMLRLLEKWGMVEAECQKSALTRGPGRSPIVFRPTPSGIQRLRELTGGEIGSQEEWELAKTHLLETLQNENEHEKLLDELLARIPDQPSELVYLAETATAIMLGLNSLNDPDEVKHLQRAISKKELTAGVGLNALLGLGITYALTKRLNVQLAGLLLSQAGKFQTVLAGLAPEDLNRLGNFLGEMSHLVGI